MRTGSRIGPREQNYKLKEGEFYISGDSPNVGGLTMTCVSFSQQLADGFQKIWSNAMRGFREIDFHPVSRHGRRLRLLAPVVGIIRMVAGVPKRLKGKKLWLLRPVSADFELRMENGYSMLGW
jgi:hypothetical protein